MQYRLQREIDGLKKRILTLGSIVEERLHFVILSLQEKNEKLAQQVIDGDLEIDELEVDLEEECLKLLALHQPVAVDLRFIVAVLKINSELERIGDLAVNIGERSKSMSLKMDKDVLSVITAMSKTVKEMLKKSLDALVNMDVSLAFNVCAMDNLVDETNSQIFNQVLEKIEKEDLISDYMHFLNVSRNLERIGDSATNIAEDVIYMIDGKIVRHKAKEYEKSLDSAHKSK